MKANFYKSKVHLTAVEPFPNHSHDVDPGVRELIVNFDKLFVCCRYSINYRPDGKEHIPIAGTPAFLGAISPSDWR
jgi:hypothetical protein